MTEMRRNWKADQKLLLFSWVLHKVLIHQTKTSFEAKLVVSCVSGRCLLFFIFFYWTRWSEAGFGPTILGKVQQSHLTYQLVKWNGYTVFYLTKIKSRMWHIQQINNSLFQYLKKLTSSFSWFLQTYFCLKL